MERGLLFDVPATGPFDCCPAPNFFTRELQLHGRLCANVCMTDSATKKMYLTRTEATAYLCELGFPITKRQLERLASIGDGPAYCRFGNKALYAPATLLAWAEARLKPVGDTVETRKNGVG